LNRSGIESLNTLNPPRTWILKGHGQSLAIRLGGRTRQEQINDCTYAVSTFASMAAENMMGMPATIHRKK